MRDLNDLMYKFGRNKYYFNLSLVPFEARAYISDIHNAFIHDLLIWILGMLTDKVKSPQSCVIST